LNNKQIPFLNSVYLDCYVIEGIAAEDKFDKSVSTPTTFLKSCKIIEKRKATIFCTKNEVFYAKM